MSAMSVLQGDYDQSNYDVFKKYFGRQCCGIAVAAMCKSCIIDPQFWTAQTVNECLIAGDALFGKSYERLPQHIRERLSYLEPCELISEVEFPGGIKVCKI